MKHTIPYLLVVGLIFCGTAATQGGVKQMRSVDSMTNVGTNAYADMDAGGGYATVNPNYSDQGTGEVVTGDYYYDYNGYTAAVPAGTQIPMGTILEYVPSRAVPLMVQGTRYYYADNVFLTEVFDGYAVVYQVVPAPVGAVVTTLPAGCIVQNYNGKSITVCGNIYYRQVAGGYEVIALN